MSDERLGVDWLDKGRPAKGPKPDIPKGPEKLSSADLAERVRMLERVVAMLMPSPVMADVSRYDMHERGRNAARS